MTERIHRSFTRRRLTQLILSVLRCVFILSICYIILSPLLNKISMSFMTPTDLYDRTVKAIPKHFTLANYADAVKYLDYYRRVGTTRAVRACGAAAGSFLHGGGLWFCAIRFKGNRILFILVIILMVIPTQILLTPQYLNFKNFGLINSLAPFILFGVTATGPRCGLYIFLARQYYRGIPREIDEAAAIDGAGAASGLPADHAAQRTAHNGNDFPVFVCVAVGGKLVHAAVRGQLSDAGAHPAVAWL